MWHFDSDKTSENDASAPQKVVDLIIAVGTLNFMSLTVWREGWYNPHKPPQYTGLSWGEVGKEVLGTRWRRVGSTWERAGEETRRLDEGRDQLVVDQ